MANVAVGQKTAESRHRALGLTDEQALEIYRLLVLARKTSERMLTLSMQGKVAIAIPSDGHEAAQIGSMLAMRPDDIIYPYYRSIPGVLARGMSVREVVLDYLARADGPSSGGRQMPGHWARPDLKLITGSSSVGTQIPHAVGSALASKIRGEDTVTIVYFGDGATSKGDFHEGLNFAGIHQLPVIFFCENNRYAISVPFSKQSAVKSAADRAQGYNMPGVSFDGMDVLETYRITREYVERARQGGGPALLEAQVYRFSLHTSHVGMENYRSKEEVEVQRRRDPIPRFQRELEEAGVLTAEQAAAIQDTATRELDEALAFAEAAPLPDPSTALRHVYKEA